MHQQPNNATRGDAMRHLVLAEEIARGLDEADRNLIVLSLIRAARQLDESVAAWAMQAKPYLQ